MGANERLITHHTASINSGVSKANGSKTRKVSKASKASICARKPAAQILCNLYGLPKRLQRVNPVAIAISFNV